MATGTAVCIGIALGAYSIGLVMGWVCAILMSAKPQDWDGIERRRIDP